MNKKEKRIALKSALTSKVEDGNLIVLEDLKFDEIKTKNFAEVLKKLDAKKALVVIKENDKNVVLSARNIPDAQTAIADNINVYDVMKAGTVVLTKDAVSKIEEVYA